MLMFLPWKVLMWLVHCCRRERRNPAYIIISRSSRESNKTFSPVVTVAPLTCRVSPALNAFVRLFVIVKCARRKIRGLKRAPRGHPAVVKSSSRSRRIKQTGTVELACSGVASERPGQWSPTAMFPPSHCWSTSAPKIKKFNLAEVK